MSNRRRLEELERNAAGRIKPIVAMHPLVTPYRERYSMGSEQTDLDVLKLALFVAYCKVKRFGDHAYLDEIETLAFSIADSLGGAERVKERFDKTKGMIDENWDVLLREMIRREERDKRHQAEGHDPDEEAPKWEP